MIHIKVRRPTVDDRGELFEFFKTVVEDTFIKEGIEGLVGDLKEEIEFKRQYLENDLDSNGKLRYFLAAEDRGCIIGTIEYGPSSDLICTCTNGEYENLYELGTVL